MSVPSTNNFDEEDDDEESSFTITRTTAGTENDDNNKNEEEQRATPSAPVTRRSKKQGPKLKLPPAADFEEHVMPYSRKPTQHKQQSHHIFNSANLYHLILFSLSSSRTQHLRILP
ncbi:hypothetical protein K457DRAFT_135329 [Linnemannia elongata AG-77]|uniref:Uncharacterized protein n=1 Tax=Linnemannia elongata AG-77 TaxID=1314771 RepID=A0A197K6T0_9FUNG|nr:hypothetical protein K457DRAFT_135329 [Linnemannia elongata AG-77]